MKIFATAFYAAMTFAAASYSTFVALDDATPVMISVHCPGIEFDGSLLMSKIAGIALVDSYNSVHGQADNDDSELSSLSYRGSHGSNAADELELGKSHSVTGVWSGLWNCHHCPDDDNIAVLKAWENEFVARLLQSSVFPNDVETCDINMSVASQDIVHAPNVDIIVKCNSPNFHDLSVPKGTFLAHAVQDSYNKVHGDAPNDDSHLDHVVYQAPADTMYDKEEQQLNWLNLWRWPYRRGTNKSPSMTGDWDCTHCRRGLNKKEIVFGVVGDALKAWEAELVVVLTDGPIASFHDISSCDIDLHPHVLAKDGASNCGLRFCAE